jgi:hypothetical protein
MLKRWSYPQAFQAENLCFSNFGGADSCEGEIRRERRSGKAESCETPECMSVYMRMLSGFPTQHHRAQQNFN